MSSLWRAPPASDTPIYDAMVAEAAASLTKGGTKGGTSAAYAKKRTRAAEIRDGSCPPWRTDVTIPPGYEGAP